MRHLFAAAAALCLGLGALGAFLPVLPTTPFVLLAAYFLSKGHPEWHARLRASRSFGPVIRDWEDRGAVSMRAKTLASVVMAALAALMWSSAGMPAALKAAILAVEGAVLVFIWSRPSV